ncbi:MAG TPA: hypothetical protein PLL15_06160 [Syntrophales bacterium]|nr:hypothetical protein [Syntrophales bacterium]
MGVLIRHYLGVEPPQDLEELLELYAEALFLEDRQIAVMAAAIGKAFSGKQ